MYIILHTTSRTRCVMNRTPLARRTHIINCLVEGNSIRSTERMTDTHRDTIMRLMVEVGTGRAALANDDAQPRLPAHSMRRNLDILPNEAGAHSALYGSDEDRRSVDVCGDRPGYQT